MLTLMGSAPPARLDGAIGWLPASPQPLSASAVIGAEPIWRSSRRHRTLPHLALSTANLYTAVQPGGTLFGLQHSNPVDTGNAYRGPSKNYGQFNDPLRLQRRWKTLYPNARQVKVPHGNHFPMCDNPQLVASAVKAFAQKP
jgi:haloalkane dehalogenase